MKSYLAFVLIFLWSISCVDNKKGISISEPVKIKKESFVAKTEENFILMKIKMKSADKDGLFQMLVDGKIELLNEDVSGIVREIKTERVLIEYVNLTFLQSKMAWVDINDIK
jgi:hypothetical protein